MRRAVFTSPGCFLAVLMLALWMLPPLAVAAPQGSEGRASQPTPQPLKLKVGDTAPDFTLLAFDGKAVKPISLHDFRGKKNVVVAFFVFAFTPG